MPVRYQNYSGNIYKYDKGIPWILVFHHNSSTGKFFVKNSYDYLYIKEEYKYSILSQLEDYRLNGGFEFLLEYPELSEEGYNHWYQTSNPIKTSTVSGYSNRSISWTIKGWAGLCLCSDSDGAFLDGSSINWHYAIGAYSEWVSGKKCFPGPYSDDYKTKYIIHEVFLWVRIAKSVLNRARGCTVRKSHSLQTMPLTLLAILISF